MTHPGRRPRAPRGATSSASSAPGFTPRLGIVLGSGLGGLADALDDAVAVPYAEIPGFPPSTVAGHAGRFVLGTLEGVPVACMQGRFHLYEGHPPAVIKLPIRTFAALGVEALLLTNAAGSLRAEAAPGSLMLITDHLNFMWTNPLVGPNDDDWGERFVGLEDAYDPELRARLGADRRRARDPPPRGRLLLAPGAALRDAGRDPRLPGARRRRRRDVDRPRGHRRPPRRDPRRGDQRDHEPRVGMSAEPIDHEQTLRGAALAAADLTRLVRAFVASFAATPAAPATGGGLSDAAAGGHPPQARRPRAHRRGDRLLRRRAHRRLDHRGPGRRLRDGRLLPGDDPRRGRGPHPGDARLRARSSTGPTRTSRARRSTSTRPAASATRSRSCWPRSWRPAAAPCR